MSPEGTRSISKAALYHQSEPAKAFLLLEQINREHTQLIGMGVMRLKGPVCWLWKENDLNGQSSPFLSVSKDSNYHLSMAEMLSGFNGLHTNVPVPLCPSPPSLQTSQRGRVGGSALQSSSFPSCVQARWRPGIEKGRSKSTGETISLLSVPMPITRAAHRSWEE